MKCPICGGEYRYGTEEVGVDKDGIPVFHRYAYCDNCRKKKDLDYTPTDDYEEDDNYNNVGQTSPYMAARTPEQVKLRNSALSVWALICTILIALAPIGVILAIIDLAVGKNDEKKHNLSIVALVLGGLILVGSYGKSKNKSSKTESYKASTTTETTSSKNTNSDGNVIDNRKNTTNNTTKSSTTKSAMTTTTQEAKPDYTHMTVGDIAKTGSIYIGLNYVKRMDYLPLVSGKETDIGDGNEVILPFFEVYNDSTNYGRMNFNDITCYADGVQANSVESYIKVQCDGIPNYYWEDIADHAKAISVQQFAVPKGWQELRFYYGSSIIWTLTQDDVKTEKFVFNSILSHFDMGRRETAAGSVIYNSDSQQIIFDGATLYSKKSYGTYVIFEFTVNNTSSASLDYDLVGYKMTAYQGNYYLGDASFVLDSQIDGHSNVFNVDSIEPGMSAKVYVAFEKRFDWNDYYVLYDDGYGSHSFRGSAYTIVD